MDLRDILMKALFLSSAYPPRHLGGYELTCAQTVAWLKEKGHRVRVLTSRLDRPLSEADDGVARSLWLQADPYFYRPLDFFLHRRARERANLESLSRLLKEFRPDVGVVCGMWNLSTRVPQLLEDRLPGRVVYYLASYWPTDPDLHTQYWESRARRWWTESLKKPLRGIALKQLRRDGYPHTMRFEHAVCCSRFVRRKLIDAGKIHESARTIQLSIPAEIVACRRNRPDLDRPLQMVYLGRLVADKGVHLALQALALLSRQDRSRVSLVVAGSGHPDYEEELRSIVRDGGLADSVVFAGQVSKMEAARILKASDVLLFTSLWEEPFGRVLMEAMAAEVLVIGAEVGAQPEIFTHGENALTFRPGDIEQLSRRISQALHDREWAARLARAGRETFVARFDVQENLKTFEAYLQHVVQVGDNKNEAGTFHQDGVEDNSV